MPETKEEGRSASRLTRTNQQDPGMKGRFLVFEGLDGCGKTTALRRLAEQLAAAGRKVLITKEPGDGPIGRLIQETLCGKRVLRPETLALLFAADRFEHVQNEILPALREGTDVLCDRYYYSSIAYQGDAVAPEDILTYNALARGAAKPDFVFYIDTPPEECLRRIRAGRTATDLFERAEKLESVRRLYETAFALLADEKNVVRIDGTGSADEVLAGILNALAE